MIVAEGDNGSVVEHRFFDEKEYAKEGDERYILVEDCLTTFKELAREHRRHFDIPVVGITGTNGKTTTKELVSAVLGEKFNVMFTQGNFNNDVGVPKTLFRLSPENEIAVVEMGASHPGDIRKLVEYVEPTCGMITNVGRAHLQGFGSFEGVKKTKGELYDYLAANDALVFINADNEHLMQMAEQRNINRLITYGKDENCVVDRNGDGKINESDKYLYKSPAAPVTMGFSSRLEYKNWDFGFSLRASIGNYVYNNVEQGMSNMNTGEWFSNSLKYFSNRLKSTVERNWQTYEITSKL